MTEDDIVICRCEGVPLRLVRQALEEGFRSPTEIKVRTRAGMGYCQGRTCRMIVADIAAAASGVDAASVEPFRPRPPVRPILLGDLALQHALEAEGANGHGE